MDAQPALTERAFSRRAVEAVREAGTPPHVSLFLPTRRAWNQAKENRLAFRDLVQGADDALQGRGVSQADSEALLQPARDLVDNDAFWREATDGLALFIAPDHLSSIRLPFRPSPLQYVDRRFHIRPLWRHVEPDGRFYVLALSQGGIRLYRASRYAAEGVPLKDVPTTLGEALQFEEHIRSVLFHTKTRPGASGDSFKRAAMYFGQEDAGDKAYIKEGIVRFFQELDGEVCRLLGQEATPRPSFWPGLSISGGCTGKRASTHISSMQASKALS